jgi:signal transduction histidine kinase
MRRAVDALLFARSVEDGLKSGSVVLQEGDVATYLAQLAQNLTEQGRGVEFIGPNSMSATFDPIALTQVLENVVDNAERYRSPLTAIELRLQRDDRHIIVEVFNEGPNIDDARIEEIFKYGVSDNSTTANHGLGLFAARSYIVAMLGTIRAENRPRGVAMIITLPVAVKVE